MMSSPETSAMLLPCTKCGRPLGVSSYFTNSGSYHYECLPSVAHPAPTAADTPKHLANLLYYGNHCLDKGTELQQAVLWAASVLTAISTDERIPPWIKQLCGTIEPATADTGLVERLTAEADNMQYNEDLHSMDDGIALMREAAEALVSAEKCCDSYAAENQRLFDKAEAAEQRVAELEREQQAWLDRNTIHIVARAEAAEASLSSAQERIARMTEGARPLLGWLQKLEAEFPNSDDDVIVGGLKGIAVTFGDLRTLTLAAEKTDGQ